MMRDTVAKAVATEGDNRYDRVRSDQPLTVVHLMTASIVFIGGLFLGALAYIGEILSHTINHKEGMKAAAD